MRRAPWTPATRRGAPGRALLVGALLAGLLAWSSVADGSGPRAPSPGATYTSVLDPWFTALDASDEAPATVAVLGDSVSEGFGVSGDVHRRWVDQLEDALRDHRRVEGCPTGPSGYAGTTSLVPAWYVAASLPDPRVEGPARLVSTVGPGGRGVVLEPGASVSWRVEATEVALGYRTAPDGGVMSIDVDGRATLAGQELSTSADAGTAGERQEWHSAARDLRTRTYRVTNTGTRGDVTVTDLTPFVGDRDRCVHVHDASHSGVSAESISQRPDYVGDSVAMNPDLLVVALGYNDARAGRTPGQLRRNLDRVLDLVRAKGYGGPILLVSWHQPTAGFFRYPWWQYRNAIRDAATGRPDTAFVDIGSEMPAITRAPRGAYLDALHPGLLGQQLITVAMTRVLTRPGETVPVPGGGR